MIHGILDHKQVLMMMEEDLLLVSRLCDFSLKMDLDHRELSGSLLGVVRNGPILKTVTKPISQPIKIKSTSILLPLRMI